MLVNLIMPSNRQKKNTWLKKQRDIALFEVYQRVLKSRRFSNQRDAINFVRKSAAPRFYISAHAAVVYVNSMSAGRKLPKLNLSSRRRIEEIYRRYMNLRMQEPYAHMSTYRICQIVVEQTAPEFYIGYDLASKVICRERNLRNSYYARRLAL